MAQQVRALIAKPDELSCCIPKVYKKKERIVFQNLFSGLLTHP